MRAAERPVGFAVVGCGGMGRWHAKTLSGLPEARLVAAADPIAAARRAMARVAGVPVHASFTALLSASGEDVEVVCVCTSPDSHVGVVEEAAAAGKHVLVEKPLALSTEEADRAIAACARAGLALGVVHQQRARSASRAVHRLLSSGRLGEPRLATVTHSWFRPPAELRSHAWRGDPLAGGGVLLDQATHAVDLLIWLFGRPRWVSGTAAATGEETAAALLGFDRGVVATLAASMVANAMRDDIALELFGSRGSVRLEVRDYDHAEIAWLDLADGEGSRARRVPPETVEATVRAEDGEWRGGPRSLPLRVLGRLAGAGRGNTPFRSPRAFLRRRLDRAAQRETGETQGHAAILRRMAAAARGGGAPLVTGVEARDGLAVIEALRRSDRSGGGRVEIPALTRA